MRRGPKPTKAEVEAELAAARQSVKDEVSRREQAEKRLAEALEQLAEAGGQLTDARAQLTEAREQQTATAEILRMISSSPTDVQPIFDVIAIAATRLCSAQAAGVFRFDDTLLHLVAEHGWSAEDLEAVKRAFPRPPGRGSVAARAILTRAVVHVRDITADPDFVVGSIVQARFRAVLSVPMLHEGKPIGAINVTRHEPIPFSDTQIALLRTFADQAVIAIENVRLFKELEEKNRALTEAHAQVTEALEQQTATSEILRVISSSPTDLQPVFDTIVRSAVLLCGAVYGTAIRFDGELMHLAAAYNYTPEVDRILRQAFPMRPDPLMMSGRAILSRDVVQVEDALEDPGYAEGVARAGGFRSMLAAPMLRDGRPIGAIVVNRGQPGPFSRTHIELLKTFADQAVIAVENVRLFKELEARNRELTESLAQQTATSEILRVISGSPTDVQPIFDTIVRNVVRLCEGRHAAVFRFDGKLVHLVAHYNVAAEALVEFERVYPVAPSRASLSARAILDSAVVHVPDVEGDPEASASRVLGMATGYRSVLSVPMLRDGAPIGAISVGRAQAGPFADGQIELVKTFGDQAVIAIENARLFTELQASNRELTAALDTQMATSEILRVISRSQTDVQPVFQAIVDSAVRLLHAFSGSLTRVVEDHLVLAAFSTTLETGADVLTTTFPQSLAVEGSHTRTIRDRVPFTVVDAETDPRTTERGRQIARARGYRSQVVVPMLRRDEAIGTISLTRREAGGFGADEIALLQTFADQAVIAIENLRLFSELRERTAELTRSVGQLTALGEVGRAVSSTLDLETVLTTIVSRAVQLAGMDAGAIYEYDEAGEVFHLRATENLPGEFLEIARPMALRKGEGAAGRLAVTREPVQISDIAAPDAYQSRLRDVLLRLGHRALLAVPLLREDRIVGGLVVNRRQPGEFAPEVIEILTTFATQSVLAIQNARLFREIEGKSRELEAASRHKSEFLANMSHELRTPLNAIIGFSEVLTLRMFGELNEKQTEYLDDIHASGQHLLSLINDILDLSKIEAGRMELEMTNFDLPQAIENALVLVRERASRRGIGLHRSVDERLGGVRADERKVKQVLLNLLSNALKFTPEGGRIDVRAGVTDGMAEVSVADTGIGIAPEDHEAVFEEFRQVGSGEAKAQGTGLGLALSRRFIELHRGKIWVKSEVGVGSTFTFSLPLAPSL